MKFTLLPRVSAVVLSICLSFPLVAHSTESYRLGVAPVMSHEETLKTYKPLASYISHAVGIQVKVEPAQNFLGYWHQMRKPDAYDFLLDGSHLAAYRVEKMGHRLLAKVRGVLSFTLISSPDDLVLDPEELVNRKVAIMPSPNFGGLKVYELFKHPARQPVIVQVKNVAEAIDAVKGGRADATYIPTPMLASYPEAMVITSSEQIPGMTMTASPSVPFDIAQAVSKALIDARKSKEGTRMLNELNLVGFEVAERDEYKGLEKILSAMWGY